jgi:prevent-host-death family protein
MEYSIREAKAHFSAAIAAVERGEHVTVTKHGKPVATIIPAVPEKTGVDWEKAARIRKQLGINPDDYDLGDEWLEKFNDPAFSRQVLGLED